MNRIAFAVAVWSIALVASSAQAAIQFFGPSHYTSSASLPAGFYAGTPTIETFEDGFNTPGVTVTGGALQGPGGSTDSVDADDGSVNGSSGNGYSWFGPGSPGITFTFTGALPTAAGIVWTDGLGSVKFEVFGDGGVPLGTKTFSVTPGSHYGTTYEDRFIGAHFAGGIKSIRISDHPSGGIEVDHLSFGTAAPEPSTMVLCAMGLAIGLPLALRRAKRTTSGD